MLSPRLRVVLDAARADAKGMQDEFVSTEHLLLGLLGEPGRSATVDLLKARGVSQRISVITNGLLLTPEVVDRLNPYGLQGVKVTLDGDRDTHNRMRPLRGRQGTFEMNDIMVTAQGFTGTFQGPPGHSANLITNGHMSGARR